MNQLNIDSAGIPTQYVSNEEAAFKLLASRRADIAIEPVHAGFYLIAKLDLTKKLQIAWPLRIGMVK